MAVKKVLRYQVGRIENESGMHFSMHLTLIKYK